MSKRNQPKKKKSGSRHRKRAIRKKIRRARAIRSIDGHNWRQHIDELELMSELHEAMGQYIDEHEASLGPDWAAAVWLFMEMDEYNEDPDFRWLYTYLDANWPSCAVLEMIYGDHLVLREGEIFHGLVHQQRALEQMPRFATGWHHHGLGWQMAGIFSKAQEAWRRALSSDLSSMNAKSSAARSAYNLGALALQLRGDIHSAKAHIRRALKLMQDYPEALTSLEQLNKIGLLGRLAHAIRPSTKRIP